MTRTPVVRGWLDGPASSPRIVDGPDSGFQGYIRLRGALRPNPTIMELACLIEMTNTVSERQAAANLGIGHQTVKNHLMKLYRRIGAHNRTQAVALLWPIVGEHLLPDRADPARPAFSDRRSGMERRTHA